MHTYTSRRNLFGSLCNNTASATLSLADTLMNMCEKRIISAKDWDFLWRQYTDTTVASQQAYKLPAYTRKPQGVYITVSSQRYVPVEVTNREDWDMLNQTVVTSNSVTHYFIYDGSVEFYPTPATSGNTITYNAKRIAKDLTIADTTGVSTITTIATAGAVTTITQSGTTWADGMVGQHIRVTQTNATKGGDGFWYEIATVPTSSTLTLTRKYRGTALATATASYTIGEVSLIPEPHDMLPIYEALQIYFTSTDPNQAKASLYENLLNVSYEQMILDHGSRMNVVIDGGDTTPMQNPNYYITL